MMLQPPPGNLKIRFEYWPLIWLWPVSLIFMQLTVLRLSHFCLNLAVVMCHVMQIYMIMVYWIKRPSDKQLLVFLFAFVYTFFLGLLASEPLEFWKSVLHVGNLAVMVVVCLNVRMGFGQEMRRSILVFCLAASAVGLLIIAQAVAFNVFRDFRLANLLGDFAPLGPGHEVYVASATSQFPRANGVFSEPSVAGWFMSFAVALALAARRVAPIVATLTAIVCALAAMATLSLTGILGAAIVLAAYVLFVRDRPGFKLFWTALSLVGIGFALHFANQFGILARFQNLDLPGTSIYFRLTAPLALISESLGRFPFGYPLGQTDFIASRDYYINWDNGSQTNIDNTLLMIVFYFGLAGIVFNVSYLGLLAKFLLLKRHAVGLMMLSLAIALSTTGAGWAHPFVLMIGYAIVVGRYLLATRLIDLRLPRPALIRPPSALPAAVRAKRPAARPRAPWQPAGGAA